MLRDFPGTLKPRSSRAGGGWRAVACAALALGLLAVLPPPDAFAKKLIQKDVSWLNSLRAKCDCAQLINYAATRPDTIYAPITATGGIDTTVGINIMDLTTPPWWQRKPSHNPQAAAIGASTILGTNDTTVTDTILVGRFLVWSDSSVATSTWITSASLFTDVMLPSGAPLSTAGLTGVMVDSTSYGTMGTTKNSLSFPIFLYVDPRFVDTWGRRYSHRTGPLDPSAIGGLQGHGQIRFRLTFAGSAIGKTRAAIQYYTD
jgi:hypothetical protein